MGNVIKARGKFAKPNGDNYYTILTMLLRVIKKDAGINIFAEINNEEVKWTALDIERVAEYVELI
ncbi:hypothetical protein [Paenibacillus nuruki]|uniref:hypothetical protein n=1 Tax=Paenibacillus nuruki TaxID=1886670 RepID=UPI000846AABF|nr:hypothetical protein [Paenibacillus nuruki]